MAKDEVWKTLYSRPFKEIRPSAKRRFEYGTASSTWLGGDPFRMGKAAFQPGDFRENIQRK